MSWHGFERLRGLLINSKAQQPTLFPSTQLQLRTLGGRRIAVAPPRIQGPRLVARKNNTCKN